MRTAITCHPNPPLVIFAASLALALLGHGAFLGILWYEESTGLGGPPLPGGLIYAALGWGQFYLLGLPATSLLTLVNVLARKPTEADAIKVRFGIIFCVAAWAFLAWRLSIGPDRT